MTRPPQKYREIIIRESSFHGTQSANLIDSLKEATSSSVRVTGAVEIMNVGGACTLRASKRAFLRPSDAWCAHVLFARVPANVQVRSVPSAVRDTTKCEPTDIGISSDKSRSAACARLDRVTVGGAPVASTELMPWHTSCPRLLALPIQPLHRHSSFCPENPWNPRKQSRPQRVIVDDVISLSDCMRRAQERMNHCLQMLGPDRRQLH